MSVYINSSKFGENLIMPTIKGGQYHLANKKGHRIEFEHLASGMRTGFQAFLNQYSETFNSSWNSTTVYGRNDAIQTFQGTTRAISLGWDMPSNDAMEAQENLLRCQKLAQMLYPVYEGTTSGASTIKASPLIRMKFVNLIQDAKDYSTFFTKEAPKGLVGIINSFNFNPDLDAGFEDPDEGVLYPKVIKVMIQYTVLHTHKMGFHSVGSMVTPANPAFPFAVEEFGNDFLNDIASMLDGSIRNTEPPRPTGVTDSRALNRGNPSIRRQVNKGVANKIKTSAAESALGATSSASRGGSGRNSRSRSQTPKSPNWMQWNTQTRSTRRAEQRGGTTNKIKKYPTGLESAGKDYYESE